MKTIPQWQANVMGYVKYKEAEVDRLIHSYFENKIMRRRRSVWNI